MADLIPQPSSGPLPIYLAEDGNLWAANTASGHAYQLQSLTNAIPGPVGPKGDKGDKGDMGPVGPAGPGTGDMLLSVYDPDEDTVVEQADLAHSVPWTGVTGVPATFPPDATAMLRSVYDPNSDDVVDHATSADAVPWTGVTGVPATFPPDATAMLKSVYDEDNNNIVDHASLADTATTSSAVPWSGITGKPTAFPPDTTVMLKSVYDSTNDGVCDHATLADAVAWTGVSGKPATFPPDSTAMLKSVYDTNSDNIVDHATLADTANAVAWANVSAKRIADFYGIDTTNTTAYAASVSTDFTLTSGATAFVLPQNSCTANPTLNINGTGAKPIVNRAGSQLASGEIEANRLIGATYDGANWRLFTRVTKLYYAANPAASQFSIECAGYDFIKIAVDFNSGTPGLNVILQHVSDGVPICISLRNTLGASVTYQIGVTGITNNVIPVYAIPSTSMGGGTPTRMDQATTILNKTASIFFSGVLNANMQAVFLNL